MSGDKHVLITLFFASLLCLAPFQSEAQKTKEQLRKEKQAKQQRIKEVEKILGQHESQKQATIGQLRAINAQIEEQQSLISSIKAEMSYLNSEIEETNMIIESLEGDLEKLKKEYASMIYSASKAQSGLNELTFLFSSRSFTELRARLKYMEQYADARKKQIKQIQKVTKTLSEQVVVIEEKRSEQNVLLKEELDENKNLVTLKNQRAKILTSLESQDKRLRKDLEADKKAIAALENKITEIINAEIAAAAARKGNSNSTLVSGSFEKNKSKFSWPVDGFVSQKFGRQNHAALKGIVVENDGIGIQTKQNEVAKAIFDGDVSYVMFIPTLGYSALIKHGEYYTVYGGLKTPLIKQGQKVKAGQVLGEVITKSEGVTELWFEIRKGRVPLNPEQWLAKH